MSRTNRFVAILVVALVACSVSGRLAGQVAATGTVTPNTPPPYRLMIMGAYYPEQGFRIASVEANGPATRLVKPGDPNSRGSLQAGDLITHVDGQRVDSLQTFYDLVKAGAVDHGKVVIRVQDMWTGKPIDWEARPVRGQGLAIEPPRRAPVIMRPPRRPAIAPPAPVPVIPPPTPDPMIPLPPLDTVMPPPALGTRQVHVLLIGLTGDPNLGRAQNINLDGMDRLVHDEIRAEKLAGCRTLRDQDVTAKGILDAVDGVQLARGDSLFVYYGGHGAFDPQRAEGDPSGGHHFQIPSGALMRKTLMKHMLDKGARLTVLISDTCNVECRADVQLPEAARSAAPGARMGRDRPRRWKSFCCSIVAWSTSAPARAASPVGTTGFMADGSRISPARCSATRGVRPGMSPWSDSPTSPMVSTIVCGKKPWTIPARTVPKQSRRCAISPT